MRTTQSTAASSRSTIAGAACQADTLTHRRNAAIFLAIDALALPRSRRAAGPRDRGRGSSPRHGEAMARWRRRELGRGGAVLVGSSARSGSQAPRNFSHGCRCHPASTATSPRGHRSHGPSPRSWLAASSPSGRLAKALTMLRRVVKTTPRRPSSSSAVSSRASPRVVRSSSIASAVRHELGERAIGEVQHVAAAHLEELLQLRLLDEGEIGHGRHGAVGLPTRQQSVVQRSPAIGSRRRPR